MKWEKEYNNKWITILDTQLYVGTNGRCKYTERGGSYRDVELSVDDLIGVINEVKGVIDLIENAPERK